MGENGTGKTSYAAYIAEKYARTHFNDKKVYDYVYVYNFEDPSRPVSIKLVAGFGIKFKKAVEKMMDKIRENILDAFTSLKHDNSTMKLDFEYDERINEALEKLNKKALNENIVFEMRDDGLISIPLNESGEEMTDDQIDNITAEQIANYKKSRKKLSSIVAKTLESIRKIDEEFFIKRDNYEYDTVASIVEKAMTPVNEEFCIFENVTPYLNNLFEDIMKNIDRFKPSSGKVKVLFSSRNFDGQTFFDRYKVNLFIDNSKLDSLPFVMSSNPAYSELCGRLDYKVKMGSFTAGHMDIMAGDIQKANGGILVIDAREILANPGSFEALKKALRDGFFSVEQNPFVSAPVLSQALKPCAVDIDLKVVMIGDAQTYYVLYDYDNDFPELFKILADFDSYIKITEESTFDYLKALEKICTQTIDVCSFTKEAANQLLCYSSRLAEDKRKFTARLSKMQEILIEASILAKKGRKRANIKPENVLAAAQNMKKRFARYHENIVEMYQEGSLLIDLEGEKIGQINGLVVIGDGDFYFGEPAKLTCSSYTGKDGVLNIERETKMAGTSHDKGVMILSGYFGERYARDKMLSFTVSMTFEQNYGYIDGDSASSAELYAMFSSLGDIPLRQDIAVTGSVSQKGEIQPIGSVNEKIEGFFEICDRKGLTGTQGVIIPRLNINNLILNSDVVKACDKGMFHIYAIDTVDEGLEILTGLDKAQIDEKMNQALEKYIETDDEEQEEETDEQK